MSAADTDAALGRVSIRRWIIIGLAVGIVLDLIIGLILGPIALQARHAASSAHISRVAAYESCLKLNQVKAADLKRWDAIVKLLETGPASPELQTFVAGVEQANKTADLPSACETIKP